MSHTLIAAAILALRPGAEFSLNGETFKGLEWFDLVQDQPTEAEVKAWISANSRKVEIDAELASLDRILPRTVEDALKGKPLYGRIAEVKARKDELREERENI